MADASSSTTPAEINITVKGPSELKLSIAIDPSKTVGELKDAVAAKSDVERDRQRLIYSGKVLKDEDTIASYKIQTGHTIHMVKGAPKAAREAAAQAPRLPANMGTGLASGNILDTVENHHGLAGFNPFAGMEGMGNIHDPNAMMSLMDNPDFLRQMSELMSRPEVVEQIIASRPELQSMGPQLRQMMQSPMFREMMSNPEMLRQMMQMQAAMGGAGGMGGGLGGFPGGGMFGAGAGAGNTAAGARSPPTDPFPNLFAPNAGAAAGTNTTGTGSTGSGAAGAGGAAGTNPPANPFASLFGAGAGAGAGADAGAGAGAGGAGRPPYPFMDPSFLFGGPFGSGFGAPGASAPPADTRPPEEIYATQLGQLSAMGLWDSAKNIRALRSTGGNVEAAIELLFSGQLDNPQ